MHIFVIGSYVQGYCWNVDWVPKAGETLIATGLNIEPGGKGLNVAVCSKRLGAEVSALFGIGEDSAGENLKNVLLQENISTNHTHILAKQSGYATGMIAKNGQNAIAVFPGPNLLLDATHVSQAELDLKLADIVYGQFEGAYQAIELSFSYAKSKNIKTVLNPSPWQEISQNMLNNTDIIIVNEVEVLHLLSIDYVQSESLKTTLHTLQDWQFFLLSQVKSLLQRWPGELLVVTLGAHCCIAIDRKLTCTAIPAFQIQAIDTICCGDAFASGFCAQYLHQSLIDTLSFANACGAIVAEKKGMLCTLPTRQQVNNFTTLQATPTQTKACLA